MQGTSNLLAQSRSVEAGIGNPIGPSYYNCNESTLSGPSFKFSTISRFQKDYLAPIAPTKKFNTCKNKDLKIFTPINRKKKNQLKAIDQNNKIEKALQKKKKMVKEKKEKFLSGIECKKQRFELKQQKRQIKVIAQSWLSLVFAIGSAEFFRAKLNSQKVLFI